jgi:hypothetical protein
MEVGGGTGGALGLGVGVEVTELWRAAVGVGLGASVDVGIGVGVGNIQASTAEGECQAIKATPIINKEAATISSNPSGPRSLRARWAAMPLRAVSLVCGECKVLCRRSVRPGTEGAAAGDSAES